MRKLENAELHRISKEEFRNAEKTPLVIILDDVRSLHNIGSVFRTCDAFLIDRIYLCGITAVPPNKEIHKTALGATETVDWRYCKTVVEAIEILKNEGLQLYAVEQAEGATFLNQFEVKSNTGYAVIFGNEVYGVSQEAISLCDGTIEIPQLGTKHSLNISVSAGIVIWDLYLKLTRANTK